MNLESISNSGTASARARSTKYKEKLGATKTKKELKTEVIELRSNEMQKTQDRKRAKEVRLPITMKGGF